MCVCVCRSCAKRFFVWTRAELSFVICSNRVVPFQWSLFLFFDFFSSIGICSIVVEFGGVDPHCCGLYT